MGLFFFSVHGLTPGIPTLTAFINSDFRKSFYIQYYVANGNINNLFKLAWNKFSFSYIKHNLGHVR